MLSKCDLSWLCVIARGWQLHAGRSQRLVSELSKSIDKKPTGSYRWWGWGRSAGSRRTAAHCETRWWAWLRIEHNWFFPLTVRKDQEKKKGGINKYILVSEVPRDKKNTGVSSLLSGGWDVLSSASGAVARCGSSELRCPCVGDERLHPTAGVRFATWTDRGLGGGKKRERGWGQMGIRMYDTRRSRLQKWDCCGIERVGDSGLSRCSSPRDESRTPHPTVSPPATHLLLHIQLSLFLCYIFIICMLVFFCCSWLNVEACCSCCWGAACRGIELWVQLCHLKLKWNDLCTYTTIQVHIFYCQPQRTSSFIHSFYCKVLLQVCTLTLVLK